MAKNKSSSPMLKWVITLTLLIALFSMAASYRVWMQQQEMLSRIDASIENKLQDSLRSLQVIQKQQIDTIQKGLKQNRKTIQGTLQSQQNVQHHLQQKADNDVELIEAESLLRLAENRLELMHDIETAMLALQMAVRRIMNHSQPEVIAIRQQIVSELKSLQGLTVPDIALYLGEIQQLANSSEGLPLISAVPETLPVVADKVQTEGLAKVGWRETWSRMLRELKPLFTIRRTNRITPPMLGIEEERLVRVILKGRYELVRQAVLIKDEALVKDTIEDIEHWHRLYFDMNHLDARSTVKSLEALKTIHFDVNYPPLGLALKLLREYRLKESGTFEQK